MAQDRSAYYKAWREANKQKLKEYRSEYYKANKDKELAKNKIYYETNKDEILLQQKKYYETNRPKYLVLMNKYREQNKLAIKKIRTKWLNANKEKVVATQKTYRESIRGKNIRLSLHAKRRSAKLNRTPCWLTNADFEKIKRKYDCAQRKTEDFKEKWVVDHIIPLQGKYVSGLHVPANLRVIKESTNLRKSNKFDMEKEWRI